MKERGKGIIFNYITLAFKLIMGLVYTPFMLSRVGSSQYGILSLANSFIIFITILDCGFGQTLIRYQSKNIVSGNIDFSSRLNGLFLKLYSLVSLIAVIIGAAIMFIYPIACKNELSPEEITLFQKVFFVLLINCILTFPLRIFSADLQAHERFSFFKGVNLFLLVIRYIIMALLLILGFKVLSLAIVISITSLLTQLAYMLYSFIKLDFSISFKAIDLDIKKEILTFSFFILINLIVDFLYDNTDKLMLGAIKGTACVTVYTLGVTFYSYFKQLSTSISGVYLPKIVSVYEESHDMNKISEIFNKLSRLQLIILYLVLNIFILFGKDFLYLWVGNGFEESYFVGLLIMVPMIIPLSQNMGQSILRAMNMHKYRSYMYLTISIINVIMTFFLAKVYGAIGAALATCIATTVGEIIFLNWFYCRVIKINLKPYWICFIKMTLMSVILMAIFTVFLTLIKFKCYNWGLLILAIIIFSIIYLLMYYLFIANDFEKNTFKYYFKK